MIGRWNGRDGCGDGVAARRRRRRRSGSPCLWVCPCRCLGGGPWAGPDGHPRICRDAVARPFPEPPRNVGNTNHTMEKKAETWTAIRGCYCDNLFLAMRRGRMCQITAKGHGRAENNGVPGHVEVRGPSFPRLARDRICPAGRSRCLASPHSKPESAPFSPPPCGCSDWRSGCCSRRHRPYTAS